MRIADGAILSCTAGEDACPLDIDCACTWSMYTPDCSDKVFSVATRRSGQGAECDVDTGATRPCAPGEDACPQNVYCAGS